MDRFFPGRMSDSSAEPKAVVKHTRLQYPNCFRDMTTFVRRIMFVEALQDAKAGLKLDSEW